MDGEFPVISFLVPMRNEERYIARCLNSLLLQDYPAIEVWVFDGCSTDRSKEIAEKILAGYQNCHLLDNPEMIQSAAWNKGIQLAQGDVISIVSAHSELATDYASKLVETLQRTGADMVGGPTHAAATGYVAEAIAIALNSSFGVGDAQFHYATKEVEVDTVFMGTCWRHIYEQLGGFDMEMVRNQDDEFSYRLRENGGTIICNPEIKSRYFNRATLRGLVRQYYQYGYYKIRVMQKHPLQMRWRQFVPSVFVAMLILSFVLGLLGFGWLSLALVLGSYLVASLIASLLTAMRKGMRYLPILPVTYGILHTSYGIGFWVGLIVFRNRWSDKKGLVPNINPRQA